MDSASRPSQSQRDMQSRTDQESGQAWRAGLVRRMAIMAAVLVVIGGALYGFNWYRQRAIDQHFSSNRPPPVPVAVVEAQLSSMPRRLAASSLAAVREVTVATEVAVIVAAIEFQSGQSTKAGNMLIRLDDRAERAERAAQQAQLRLAQQTLSRAETLRERAVTAQATLDQAVAQVEQLTANVQRAQVAIDRKLITAPFDGELGVRQVDLGQFLSPGSNIVTLTDLSRLYVNFSLPEQARQQVRAGLPVEIRSDAFPGRTFPGIVTAIDPQVDPGTRAIRVQATMANPERLLLPGMFADVTILLPAGPDAVTLPETALIYTLYGDSVYVVREKPAADGKPQLTIERVLVKVGERLAGRVAIVSGVNAGERAVVSGQNRLTDGAAVTIATSGAASDTPAKAAQSSTNATGADAVGGSGPQ